MKPIRQNVIPYVLVLLVALAIPQIASADDPCKDFNDKVTKFVSEMPRLSSSELTFGRFYVENNKISYLVNGRKILKEWHDSCDPSDEFCKAQITPIRGLGGYGGLHIAQQGRHFALTCDHLIFPSSTTNSFKSVSKPWSITVKDLDNDNVSEVISHELQQWALECDLCLACIDATAWNNIYHFSSEGNLLPVNEHFSQRYAELLTQYRNQYDRFKQDTKNYVNACNYQQLSNQFQALINRAEKLALPIPYPVLNGQNGASAALSPCVVAAYADLARQAYEVAGFGKGLWVSVPPWELVDKFVDTKLSHGIDIGTGLKAGLFRNIETNDLAIFFAGTDRDKDFEAEVAETLHLTRTEKIALCVRYFRTCDFLGSAYLQFKNGAAIDVWSSSLSGADPNVLLSESAFTDRFYAFIGLMWSSEPDVNSDISIAYPKLDPTPKKGARAMFEMARNQYDIWDSESTRTDRFGSAGSGRIKMVGGHSLGGSIAQVVGLSKNVATITFNSAPAPLDPEYRNEISYDPNRNNMLNVRSSDDLMTGFMFSLQSNDRLRSLLTTLIESIYQQRGYILDKNLKSRFEAVINANNFYAGKRNWLVNDAQTGHDIEPLAENLKNKNSCGANSSGTVPLGIKPNVAKDNKVKQAAPKIISKTKKHTRALCNKGSSVSSPSMGGAQGALKKFGAGTDECAH